MTNQNKHYKKYPILPKQHIAYCKQISCTEAETCSHPADIIQMFAKNKQRVQTTECRAQTITRKHQQRVLTVAW